MNGQKQASLPRVTGTFTQAERSWQGAWEPGDSLIPYFLISRDLLMSSPRTLIKKSLNLILKHIFLKLLSNLICIRLPPWRWCLKLLVLGPHIENCCLKLDAKSALRKAGTWLLNSWCLEKLKPHVPPVLTVRAYPAGFRLSCYCLWGQPCEEYPEDVQTEAQGCQWPCPPTLLCAFDWCWKQRCPLSSQHLTKILDHSPLISARSSHSEGSGTFIWSWAKWPSFLSWLEISSNFLLKIWYRSALPLHWPSYIPYMFKF